MSIKHIGFVPAIIGVMAVGLLAMPSHAGKSFLTVEGLIHAYNGAGCPASINCLNNQEKVLKSVPEETWASQEFGIKGVAQVLQAAYSERNCCGINHRYSLIYDILPESFWKSRESMSDFVDIIELAQWPDSISLPYPETTQKFIIDRIPAKVWCSTSQEYMVREFGPKVASEIWVYAWGVWVEAHAKVCPLN